jgi:hypothetical protein
MYCIYFKKDKQRTCNVTLRRVRANTVAVEKQWVLHNLSVCICSFRYPACHAHAPWFHLWPALLCNIFPHYLVNGTIFEKITEHKMCFEILQKFFLKHFFLIINERDIIKNVYIYIYVLLYNVSLIYKKCVYIFYHISLIYKKCIYIHIYCSSCKVPFILVRF